VGDRDVSSSSRSSAKFHSRGVFLAICFSLVSSFHCLPSIRARSYASSTPWQFSLIRFTALRSLPLSTCPLSRVLSNSASSFVPFYSRASVSLPPTLVCAALWMVVGTHLERAAQSAATHKPVSWLSDSSHFPGRRIARRTRTQNVPLTEASPARFRGTRSAAVAIDDQPGPVANR